MYQFFSYHQLFREKAIENLHLVYRLNLKLHKTLTIRILIKRNNFMVNFDLQIIKNINIINFIY